MSERENLKPDNRTLPKRPEREIKPDTKSVNPIHPEKPPKQPPPPPPPSKDNNQKEIKKEQ